MKLPSQRARLNNAAPYAASQARPSLEARRRARQQPTADGPNEAAASHAPTTGAPGAGTRSPLPAPRTPSPSNGRLPAAPVTPPNRYPPEGRPSAGVAPVASPSRLPWLPVGQPTDAGDGLWLPPSPPRLQRRVDGLMLAPLHGMYSPPHSPENHPPVAGPSRLPARAPAFAPSPDAVAPNAFGTAGLAAALPSTTTFSYGLGLMFDAAALPPQPARLLPAYAPTPAQPGGAQLRSPSPLLLDMPDSPNTPPRARRSPRGRRGDASPLLSSSSPAAQSRTDLFVRLPAPGSQDRAPDAQ